MYDCKQRICSKSGTYFRWPLKEIGDGKLLTILLGWTQSSLLRSLMTSMLTFTSTITLTLWTCRMQPKLMPLLMVSNITSSIPQGLIFSMYSESLVKTICNVYYMQLEAYISYIVNLHDFYNPNCDKSFQLI